MKNAIFFLLASILLWACAKNGNDKNAETNQTKTTQAIDDDGKGIGEIKEVSLNVPLNQTMVSKGKATYDMKCAACHKLNKARLIGPGFDGITKRRTPEWVMNMITNVDMMLDKDPTAQKLLDECKTRMPNQNVSQEDARNILEFFYNNDAK